MSSAVIMNSGSSGSLSAGTPKPMERNRRKAAPARTDSSRAISLRSVALRSLAGGCVMVSNARRGAQMRTVILAGGLGTRLGEETAVRPKPMVEIGGMPILWHIMKIYSAAGLNDFVVCLGYKGYLIKEFFANYFLHTADVTIDLRNGNGMEVHHQRHEPWRITLVETGATTMTGGRLAAIRPYLEPGEPFCFTYGDGVADIDVGALVDFHKAHGARATIT